MIRSLRQRHRVAAFLLAGGLPVLLIAAWAVRPAPWEGQPLPEALRPSPAETMEPGTVEQLGSLPVFVGLTFDQGRQPILVIVETESIGEPDLLLYWTADRDFKPNSEGLPQGARLIGALGKGGSFAYSLPVQAIKTDTRLLAYRLARQTVIESIAMPWASGNILEVL